MPEAALSVDEGAISVLFFLFHQFELFHSPNELVSMLMKQVQNVIDLLLLTIYSPITFKNNLLIMIIIFNIIMYYKQLKEKDNE